MGDKQYFFVVGCLIASAACLLVSAVVGYVRSRTLKNYVASLEKAA